MRYLFITLIGISTVLKIGHAEIRSGLAHRPLPSPDGEHLALISEWRHNEAQEYTLTLLTRKKHDYYRTYYSLTPRIKEVLLTPDGETVAYLARDFCNAFGIYFYFPDKDVSFGIDYSNSHSKLEKLQFAKDQQYLRYYVKPFISHDGSTAERIGAAIATVIPGQWVAMSLKNGKFIFSKKEQGKIEWAPIERPKEIPAFLTQPVPKIKRETQMQWAPDSKSLYLLDDTGVWRSDIGKPFIYQWTQIVDVPSVSRFQLSPKGTHLLYEVWSENQEERAIWILGVEPKSSNPSTEQSREIGTGWSATFSQDGNFVFYGNLSGFYQFDLNQIESRELRSTSWTP